jgi:site-specific DNA recombinase
MDRPEHSDLNRRITMSEAHSTIRAVAYHRKSDQDDGGSVEQQRQWAQSVCPGKGIEIVKEFTDQAVSGHDTDKRLGFKAMLKFCQDEQRMGRPIDAVVCWHSNRFSRADSNETGYYVWSFRQASVNRIFTSGGWIDFREMADRIMFNLTQDVSNHAYSKDLSRAALRGHLKNADAGLWNGGPAPFGYRVVDQKLIIDPETAPWATWIFRTYADRDVSLNYIAGELTRQGIPTPRGGRFWTPRTVAFILHNETYLGNLPFGRTARGKFFTCVGLDIRKRSEIPAELISPRRKGRKENGKEPRVRWKATKGVFVKQDVHDPLIDRDTFDRVQKKLALRTKQTTPIAGGGDFLLSGLVWCGHCGSAHTPRH